MAEHDHYWALYYADGSRYDSTMGEPWQSPPGGIAAMRQRWRCDSGHHPASPPIKPEPAVYAGSPISANFYVWREDAREWIGTVDIFGVLLLGERYGRITIRQGEMMPHNEWEQAWPRITDDPAFAA